MHVYVCNDIDEDSLSLNIFTSLIDSNTIFFKYDDVSLVILYLLLNVYYENEKFIKRNFHFIQSRKEFIYRIYLNNIH